MELSSEELEYLLTLLLIEESHMEWNIKQDRTWGKYRNIHKMKKDLPIVKSLYGKFKK